MDFLNKYKRVFFPQIKDWTGDHDLERKRADWWKLKVPEFLLFSPVAFKMLIMGMLIMATLASTYFSIVLYIGKQYIWAVLLTALALRLYWAIYQKIKSWEQAKYLNIYELFFRE